MRKNGRKEGVGKNGRKEGMERMEGIDRTEEKKNGRNGTKKRNTVVVAVAGVTAIKYLYARSMPVLTAGGRRDAEIATPTWWSSVAVVRSGQ
jgi:hypothetical protein